MNDANDGLALSKRDPALDWLRGVLVLFVLMLHAEIISGIGRYSVVGYLDMAVGPMLMPAFFLLSGLLGRGALRRKWVELFGGTVVRLLWPYFIWGSVYVLAVTLIEQKFELDWQAVVLLFTRPAMLGPVWYLAYLVVFFLLARCVRSIPVWITLIVLVVATMTISHLELPFKDALVHATAFFAGLAVNSRSEIWGRLSRNATGAIALLLTVCVLSVSPYFFGDGLRDNGLFITWIVLASGIVVLGAKRLYGLFGSQFVKNMGIESLAFYLTHWPVMLIVSRINAELHLMDTVVTFWVALVSSVAVGVLAVRMMRKFPLVLRLFEAPRLPWIKEHKSGAAGCAKPSRLLT